MNSLRVPRFFKQLFKFSQLNFEVAVWEMTHLIMAPNKVFKPKYYNKQTGNSWHQPDPSFTYLLSAFLLVTALAWGVAYSDGIGSTITIAFTFIFVHFIGISLLVSLVAYISIKRFLSIGGPGVIIGSSGATGSRRQSMMKADQIEFGYCFDVSIRSFFPVWVFLYVVQFLLMPIVSRENRISVFVGNTIYLVAMVYYVITAFMGYHYHVLSFLRKTPYLLVPLPVIFLLFIFFTAINFSLPRHFAPILWAGADLRSSV